MADDPQLRSFLVAAGLVVAAVVVLVVFWKITQSLLKLCFWAAVLAVIVAAIAWLLAHEGIIPSWAPSAPFKTAPVNRTDVASGVRSAVPQVPQ
jgi:predicted PurR-regulated permease PerM